MNPLAYIIAITSLVFIILTVIVIIKRKNYRAYEAYIAFYLTGTLWLIIGVFETSNLKFNQEINLLISKLDFVIAGFIAYFITLFAIYYPKEAIKLTRLKEILLLTPIIFTSVISLDGKIFFYVEGRLHYSLFWYFCYFFIILIYFVFAQSILFIKRNNSKGIERKRLNYISNSLFITLFIGLFFSVLLAYIPHRGIEYGISNVATLVFAFGSSYAMFRYRFLDINLIIKKSAIKLLSFILLFSLYFIVIFLTKDFITNTIGDNDTALFIAVVLLSVISLEVVRKFVYTFIDRLFSFKNKKKIEIEKRTQILRKSRDSFNDLLRDIALILKDATNTNQVVFLESDDIFLKKRPESKQYLLLKGKIIIVDELPYRVGPSNNFSEIYEELKDEPYSVLLPIVDDTIEIGCFGIGKRNDPRPYSVQEVEDLYHQKTAFTEALISAKMYKQALERISR